MLVYTKTSLDILRQMSLEKMKTTILNCILNWYECYNIQTQFSDMYFNKVQRAIEQSVIVIAIITHMFTGIERQKAKSNA